MALQTHQEGPAVGFAILCGVSGVINWAVTGCVWFMLVAILIAWASITAAGAADDTANGE